MSIFISLPVSFLFFLILSNHPSLSTPVPGHGNDVTNSTNAPLPAAAIAGSRISSFKPGVAVIVGILTTVFSVTFLLLLYVKHCKRGNYADSSRGYYPPSRRNSGIDRKVIESLPMFRFSSLRGQKEGLECAVCLNKFEPDEVLRLLPKCKHAFHIECVDTWLDGHSTCPLCRYRVDPEDVLLVDSKLLYSNSGRVTPRISDQGTGKENGNPRISGRHSYAGERGSSLEIIVENPGGEFRGRVSLDSWNSRRKKTRNSENWRRDLSMESWKSSNAENPGMKSKASRKDGQLPVQGDKHRLEHRIIISGGEEAEEGERRRWSDVQAAEFLYLRKEMILGEGEDEEGSGRDRRVLNERSVSEITGMSRYWSNNGGREREEEGVAKRWLAWISQSQEQQQQQSTAVCSATSPAAIAG
ncbi:UNVERIFIED_CONTAM: RING-H2 finger protein ATL43 [Sesamum angustifolium]|uniref:RING-type E3 ubiquitin transferase n=1 Tax=Sesamum angustifolium TaxID=2727405 RepID=A0AAW2PW99_9LAMI